MKLTSRWLRWHLRMAQRLGSLGSPMSNLRAWASVAAASTFATGMLVAVVATPAAAGTLSGGCVSAPAFGGFGALRAASAWSFPFNAGETLAVAFSKPSQGATTGTLTLGQGTSLTGVSSQSTHIPGSVSYTFLGTSRYNLKASVNLGLAVMSFSCSAPRDTDLALSGAPADLTVDATSPAGASVSFTAPTALDEETPPPVLCDHPSGSTFPIGATKVTCTATDPDDTPSAASASFTVNVLGAAAQLDQLEAAVQGVGPGKSLPGKIERAETDLTAGDVRVVCQVLKSFVNEVRALDGASIDKTEAAALLGWAGQIEAVLAC